MKLKLIGLFCLFFIISSRSAPVVVGPENDDDDPSRLPHTTHPTHYEIHLWTPMDYVTSGDTSFRGLVKISIEVDEDNVNEIVMHSKEILVDETGIKLTRGVDEITVTFEHGDNDLITFTTIEVLNKGDKLTLEIPYTAELQRNMVGFYQSSYRAKDTNEIR